MKFTNHACHASGVAALCAALVLGGGHRAFAEATGGSAKGLGTNAVLNGDFTGELSGWTLQGQAVVQAIDGVPTLSVSSGGVVQQIALDLSWRTLRLTLRLRAVGVDVGDQDWKTARLAMCFYGADGRKAKGWPNVFMSSGNTGWAVCQRDYAVPTGAVRLELCPANFGRSGCAEFQDIRVEPRDPARTDHAPKPAIMVLSTPDAIDARNLPRKDRFHIFILMGQSNMHGMAPPPDAYRRPDPRVLSLQLDGQWAPARTPLDMWRVGGFSLGESFGRHYAELHPGVTVGLIMAAQAGDSIEELSKGAADSTGRAVYDDAMRLIKPALAQGTVKAVLWHQGEANARDKAYPAKLKHLVEDLRADLGDPELPFVAGELGQFTAWYAPFNQALPATLKAIPRTALASSEGLADRGDKVHFSGDAAELLGRRYLSVYLALVEPPLASKVDVTAEGSQTNGAAMPAGFFPFAVPWDDTRTGVATDVSFLNDKPAGKHGGIGIKDGHFVEPDTGKRIRFFGVNMGASEGFPDKADAEMFAKRLAKAGVNIVRLHSLDNPWPMTGCSIWDRHYPDHQHFDAAQLDKLDYLIDQLKRNGIYVNLNLKVTKELTPADGMPASITNVPFLHQKRIDFFQRRMIELQEDYARKLLAHRNPYTGLPYTEDPAVACVEINNENSLLGFWTSSLGRGLETLPEPFKTELETLWTAWLKQRYGSADTLRAAWMEDATPPGESLLSSASRWTLETQKPSLAEMTQLPADDPHAASGVVVTVKQDDPTDWHVQAHLAGLTLQEGAMYTLAFRAKAENRASMRVNVRQDVDDWHYMGLATSVDVGTELRPYTVSFRASGTVPGHARLDFVLGHFTGPIWISDVRLAPGARDAGLQKGDSPDTRVHLPGVATERQWSDWLAFLVDTERAYADEMRHVLKDELKIHANVVLTQVDYGGTAGMHREQKMDYADGHAYWQHPSFANNDWNPNHWTIPNTPQVAAFSDARFGALGDLAMIRIADKPFSVSEYDHPAPTDYACEMMPEYATFAALQDWDSIYTFAIAAYTSARKPNCIQSYFDQSNHPAKWAFYPTAALIFRQGLIPPARIQATLWMPALMWQRYAFAPEGWQAGCGSQMGFLTRRLAVSDQPLATGAKAIMAEQGSAVETGPAANEAIVLKKTKFGQAYVSASPSVAVLAGYIGGETLVAGGCTITAREFGNNFAAVTVVATDGRPLSNSTRVLVTICGRVENQDMGWNAARTTVGSKWGHGPTIAQYVPAQLSIRVEGVRQVYALAPDGARAKRVQAETREGRVAFAAQMSDGTLFYEIATQ